MSVVVEAEHFGELYCPTCETSFRGGRLCPRDGTRLVMLTAVIDPIIGRELDGRFTVIEKLGAGGMGTVYRAHQHSVDREVAVKVIGAARMADPEAIKRFLREAKLTSKLNHPNAVGVLDFGQTDDGVFFLVMELVNGSTLDHVMRTEGTLSPDRVIKIGTQVCDALEVAHGLQIVHRDLKPSNIMVLSTGRDFVKVLDFGLARVLDITGEVHDDEEPAFGTPAFMPPERALYGVLDARGDLYSLGCVLHLLATGKLPATDPQATHVLPVGLAEVILRLLAHNPNDRYQSAREARAALEHAAIVPPQQVAPAAIRPLDRDTAASLESTMLVRPLTVIGRRRTLVIVASAVVALALVAVVAIGLLKLRSTQDPVEPVIIDPPKPVVVTPPPPPEPESVKPAVEPTAVPIEDPPASVVADPPAVEPESPKRIVRKKVRRKKPPKSPKPSITDGLPAELKPLETKPVDKPSEPKPKLPF